MRSVIVFASTHHGNTKKVVETISEQCGAELIDATVFDSADLSVYDIVGIASGIAYGRYYPKLLSFIENNLPDGKPVFFLHTAGSPKEEQNASARVITDRQGCGCLGTYCCKGFDTFGPFKLIGGLGKGHPDQKEINEAVRFFENICADR